MRKFSDFVNENVNLEPLVKKGEQIQVKLMFLKNQPDSMVEAYYDSDFNNHFKTETFSFLFGGDMMMFAKWDGEKWFSD